MSIFSSKSPPAFVGFYFVDLRHSDYIRWNLKVVFICIFLIARDDEHFLKYFLAVFFLFWELSALIQGLIFECGFDFCFEVFLCSGC